MKKWKKLLTTTSLGLVALIPFVANLTACSQNLTRTPLTTVESSKTIDVNQFLFNEAQKQTQTISTTKDFVKIDPLRYKGTLTPEHKDGELPSLDYDANPFGVFDNYLAEFQANDAIQIVFDDPNEIKDFTNRVFYDNTDDQANEMPINTVNKNTIYFYKMGIENGQVVAKPGEKGDWNVGAKSFFHVQVVAKNAVDIIFNDVFAGTENVNDIAAQMLYLKNFNKANSKSDVWNVVAPFVLTKQGTPIRQNYLTKDYLNKEHLVGAYEQIYKFVFPS